MSSSTIFLRKESLYLEFERKTDDKVFWYGHLIKYIYSSMPIR